MGSARWIVLWMLCVPLSVASAQSARDMAAEAVNQYTQAMNTPEYAMRQERFRQAQRLFAQVIGDHGIENADLYTNLGNAALQGRQLGPAILAYRRALGVDPGHRVARQNLDHARQMLPDWVPRAPTSGLIDTFFIWHRMLSGSEQRLLATLCFALAAVAAGVAIRWRRTWARAAAVFLGTLWIGLMGLHVWQGRWARSASEAVITVPEAVMRAADSDGAPARLSDPLPDGTEVSVIERRDDWARIRLADGRDGYVRTSSLSLIDQW